MVLPASATLNGAVADDGLPLTPGLVTGRWTQVSGPGFVTFANASAVTTAAGFSTPGSYVLRLTGSDGALNASDDVSVTVTGNGSPAELRFESVQILTGAQPAVWFRFGTEANRSHTIQYRDSLSGGEWIKLTSIPPRPNGQLAEFSEPIPANHAARFYRLVSP